jgi:ribosomal protein L3
MRRFEQIVRPFQLPNVTYPTRIFDPTKPAAVEDVVKTYGLEGQAKEYQCSFNSNVTTYKDEKVKEKDRTTSKKKITNPDDESQFVEVELIDKLTTTKGAGSKWQKSEYEFKNK